MTSTWSAENLTLAYEDARVRLKLPIVPNYAKVKMDSEGNLTVSFDKPVNYPKYILNSFDGIIKTKVNSTHLEAKMT